MGFYIRKSVRSGPFRLNISRSGLGVSAGIPGVRVGSGPRGSYVHMGRHGVYYRSSYRGHRPTNATPPASPSVAPPSAVVPSDVVLHDVRGATVVELAASTPSDLVAHLDEAAALSPFNVLAWLRGRRSVPVFYDVNDAHAEWFERLVDAFDALTRAGRVWHVTARGDVADGLLRKSHGGATDVVQRVPVTFLREAPKPMKANIAVPGLAVAARSLHFLPDQLLVKDGRRFATVPYAHLTVERATTQFVEDGPVPSDAEQVATTWRHSNKDGGPDHRYKDNPQLPVMRYAELTFATTAGLQVVLMISGVSVATSFADAVTSAPSSAG